MLCIGIKICVPFDSRISVYSKKKKIIVNEASINQQNKILRVKREFKDAGIHSLPLNKLVILMYCYVIETHVYDKHIVEVGFPELTLSRLMLIIISLSLKLQLL